MNSEDTTADEDNPLNNKKEKLTASVPSECLVKTTTSNNSDPDSDCSFVSNRHASLTGRLSNKQSERIKTLHKNLQVSRDFRHPQRHKIKMRPDSPLPPTKSNKTRIEELENLVLALRSELQLAKTSSSTGQRQRSVKKSIANLLDNDSYSDSDGDRTLIAQADINTSASTPAHTEDGFTLVQNKKQSPKHPAKSAKQQQPNQVAFPIAPNIYEQLPCTNAQSEQMQCLPSTSTQADQRDAIAAQLHKQQQQQKKEQPQLSQQQQKSTQNGNSRDMATGNKRPKRPPPIITYGMDVKQTNVLLNNKLGHKNYTFKKVNANCTHIQTESNEDHENVRKTLTEKEVPHHSYTLPGQRRTNLILRNLCRSYEQEDVVNAITSLELNIKIANISQFATEKSRRENKNFRMWLIQLEPQSDVPALLKTTKLLNQVVRFEHQQAKGISQCRNCQHFGHAASNCSRPYRCIKCPQQHLPGNCALETLRANSAVEVKPHCVNCQGEHPANFRGCPSYINYVNIKAQRQQAARAEQETRRTSYNNYRNPNSTYAATVSNRQHHQPLQSTTPAIITQKNHQQQVTIHQHQPPPPQQHQGNVLDFLDNECNDKFGIDLSTIIEKAATFIPKYTNLPENQKALALIKFTLSIIAAKT